MIINIFFRNVPASESNDPSYKTSCRSPFAKKKKNHAHFSFYYRKTYFEKAVVINGLVIDFVLDVSPIIQKLWAYVL